MGGVAGLEDREEKVGCLARLLLLAKRVISLGSGDARLCHGVTRLPHGERRPAEQRDHRECARGHGGPIASSKLANAVAERITTREDWTTIEVATQIRRKLFDGGVSAIGLFVQGPQHDDVEVPNETAPE